MPIGDLTKQLAEQAFRSATAPKAPDPPPRYNLGADLLAQVQAMQKALKEDEELQVLFHAGGETVRVYEFFLPSWHVAVLTGTGAGKSVTRAISPVESLQLVCKVTKTTAGGTPARIKFVTPKP
ncbi:MAG TPA: hypothetical protein VKR61_00030 [Bryobacteraceae bacterium]|nr:hypothetical protein [Bryobacteraceae bacterium]